VDRIFYGQPRLYQDELIQCQSDHGDYACSRGVALLSGVGMNSSTQVPVARHAWVMISQSKLIMLFCLEEIMNKI
jgi:hypothetical protein